MLKLHHLIAMAIMPEIKKQAYNIANVVAAVKRLVTADAKMENRVPAKTKTDKLWFPLMTGSGLRARHIGVVIYATTSVISQNILLSILFSCK